jgi:tRNA dimethylallyltransferase
MSSLRILTGPTASGKSAVAFHLAKQERAQLLSIDSMKIYRRLDIGTAKPTPEMRKEVVHHQIDILEPHERYSVAGFLRDSKRICRECDSSSTPLIAEGGTPLYLKSLSEGMFEGPGRDEALRKRLESEAEAVGVAGLHERLKKIDAKAAEKILTSDLRRIVRALEVYELTGQPISQLQTQWGSVEQGTPVNIACLMLPRSVLYQRIDRRVEAMLCAGWLEECRALLDLPQPLSKEAAQAMGYRTLFKVLKGELKLADARERICFDTHHFARRQIGWFKRLSGIRFIEVAEDEPLETIAERVQEAWDSNTNSDTKRGRS